MDGSLGANKIAGWFLFVRNCWQEVIQFMYVFLDAFYSFCLRESVGHRHQHLHDNFHTYTFSYFTKMKCSEKSLWAIVGSLEGS